MSHAIKELEAALFAYLFIYLFVFSILLYFYKIIFRLDWLIYI